MGPFRRFLQIVYALLFVIFLGVIGYTLIEDMTPLDAPRALHCGARM